ncbi:hypothetical protein [Methanimicrococcus stummii]|nr:hypothetical protein [Methanimicrococcus sp. Es2]
MLFAFAVATLLFAFAAATLLFAFAACICAFSWQPFASRTERCHLSVSVR